MVNQGSLSKSNVIEPFAVIGRAPEKAFDAVSSIVRFVAPATTRKSLYIRTTFPVTAGIIVFAPELLKLIGVD